MSTLTGGLMHVLEAWGREWGQGLAGVGEALWRRQDFCRTSPFFLWSAFFPFLPSSRMGSKSVLAEGWGLAVTPGCGLSKHPGSLWSWEAGQVDCAHAAARETLEDGFTSCQILLVATVLPEALHCNS